MAAVAAVLAALLAAGATVPSVAAPAPLRRSGPATQLQRDVDAVGAAGIVGVLGERLTPRGRQRARSGIADLDSRRPVPYGASFRIGSTTKTLVAVVILQLAGEGRLSLDDSVDRWLPGLVAGNGNDGSRITVRQLLQHTSGLYDYIYELIPDYDTPQEYQRNLSRTYTPEQRVAIAMRHPPNFAPGTAWSYSNTNYVLAGMLIQQVTGHPWYREVGKRILGPLRLRHTRTPDAPTLLPTPHARTYQQFTPDGPLIDTTNAAVAWESDADGSMTSTTGDLNRFFRALLDGRLLRPAQLTQMQDTVATNDPLHPGAGYGLGLEWRPLTCGGGYWGHGGNGFGYSDENGVTPNGRRSVVVSLTSRGADPDAALQQQQATDTLIDHALCAAN